MRNIFILSTGILLLFGACKNDLELNAKWKDITIVYGLLNQKDSVHYLKINKAYLGEGNAYIMAKIPDSSTYYNNLDVSIEEWKNGQYNNKTIVFDTTTIYNKDTGTFYYPNQIIYKSTTKLDNSDNDMEYRLNITNKITGKVITSKTKLIKKIKIEKPSLNVINPVVDLTTEKPSVVKLTDLMGCNALYFKVYYRFHYFEQDLTTMNTSMKYLDFYIGETVKGDDVSEVSFSFPEEKFYITLKGSIPYNPNVIRKIKMGKEFELIIYTIDFDFYTYLQFAKNSNGIAQDMLMLGYSNIENGIGIFASRYCFIAGYDLTVRSLDSLYSGSITKDLGFINN